jgi:hypothetical protein
MSSVNFLEQIVLRNPNLNAETGERLQIPAGEHILTLSGFNWGPAKPSNNSDSKYFEFVFTHPDYPRNPYSERTYYQNKQGELIRTKETGDLFWLDNLTSILIKLNVKLPDIKSRKFKMPAVGTQGSISSLIRRGVQILALFEEVVEENKETGKKHKKIKVTKFTKLPNAKGELVSGENNNNSTPVIPAEFKALPIVIDEDDHYGDSEMSESDTGTSSVISNSSISSTRPAGLEQQGSNKRQKNTSTKSSPIVIDTTSKSFAEKEAAALKEVADKLAAKRKEAEEKERAKNEKEAQRIAEKEEKERAKAEEKKLKELQKAEEKRQKDEEAAKIKLKKELDEAKRKQEKQTKEQQKEEAKRIREREAAEKKREKEEDKIIKQKIKDQMAKTGGVSVNFPSQPQHDPNSKLSMVSSQASEASSSDSDSSDSDSEDFDDNGMDLSTM